jgi:hypothetical protein
LGSVLRIDVLLSLSPESPVAEKDDLETDECDEKERAELGGECGGRGIELGSACALKAALAA